MKLYKAIVLWLGVGVFGAGILPVQGAYPLVVDDAGVHPPGETEWVGSADGARARANDLLAANFSLAVGVVRPLEASVGFGYGWIKDRTAADTGTKDGVLDLTVGLKALLYGESGPVTFTVSSTLKLPTASDRAGLGNGDTDLSVLAIATGNWNKVSVDLNGGYTWSLTGDGLGEHADGCFAGVALRWQATAGLMLFAETYGNFPTVSRTDASGVARAGWQIEFRKGVLLGGAIGTGYGPGAVKAVGSLGVTIVY